MFFLEQLRQQNTSHLFDLRDRGLLLADGVFDTSLVIHGSMILREAHLSRLVRDASALDISISLEKISTLLDRKLTRDHNGILRITVTSGPAERGLANAHQVQPTVLLGLSPLNTDDQFSPITLQTSLIRRNSTSPASIHKTLAYTDNIIALRDACTAGYDDALFLNESGHVCCTTGGNLFLKFGDTWMTPLISDGVLPGVMRQWVIDSATEMGLKITEQQIAEEALSFAESAFMTNSVRLLAPVQNLDTRKLDSKIPDSLRQAAMGLVSNF